MGKFHIPILKIDLIFISHLHGDHYLGLMGLLFSMHLQKRNADLHVFAPKGLDEIILLQLKYSKSSLNYNIHFHAIKYEAAILFEDEALLVETIPLLHKVDCTGFLFKEKSKPRKIDKGKLPDGMLLQHIALLKTGQDIFDREGNLLYQNDQFTLPPRPSFSYAYCSDTARNDAMVEQIRGCSLLYHEATFMETEANKAIETRHSTAHEAASIAQLAGAKKLIIGHFSARYRELDELLLEAKTIFDQTELAIEGTTFELEP